MLDTMLLEAMMKTLLVSHRPRLRVEYLDRERTTDLQLQGPKLDRLSREADLDSA
jgi:hypothetical protein